MTFCVFVLAQCALLPKKKEKNAFSRMEEMTKNYNEKFRYLIVLPKLNRFWYLTTFLCFAAILFILYYSYNPHRCCRHRPSSVFARNSTIFPYRLCAFFFRLDLNYEEKKMLIE